MGYGGLFVHCTSRPTFSAHFKAIKGIVLQSRQKKIKKTSDVHATAAQPEIYKY